MRIYIYAYRYIYIYICVFCMKTVKSRLFKKYLKRSANKLLKTPNLSELIKQ